MARPSSARNGRRRSTELEEELATPRKATRALGKRHEMTYRKNPFSELVERTVDALKGTISEVRLLGSREEQSRIEIREDYWINRIFALVLAIFAYFSRFWLRSAFTTCPKRTFESFSVHLMPVSRLQWAMCRAFWPRSVRG